MMTLADQFDQEFQGDLSVPVERILEWFDDHDPGAFIDDTDEGQAFFFSDGSTVRIIVRPRMH
jgi:hypothetical protein